MKDLNQLKNQLEEIQRRIENEVSVGIPQVSFKGASDNWNKLKLLAATVDCFKYIFDGECNSHGKLKEMYIGETFALHSPFVLK